MNGLDNELIFVYGLIALVIILIIVIIIIDKRDSKKHNRSLYDTLTMKAIDDKTITEYELKKEKTISRNRTFDFFNKKPEMKVATMKIEPEKEEVVANDISPKEEIEDLEKTQAQIRVEEIQEALKKAQVDEKIEENKYQKFEEEQEQNAIISYNELKKSYDKLYTENEKIQYMDDDKIPINIEELYELKETVEQEEAKDYTKVVLEDFSSMLTSSKKEEPQEKQGFKNSPLISPVYGIQKSPVEEKKHADIEIQTANQFLQSLKELKDNLD